MAQSIETKVIHMLMSFIEARSRVKEDRVNWGRLRGNGVKGDRVKGNRFKGIGLTGIEFRRKGLMGLRDIGLRGLAGIGIKRQWLINDLSSS